MSIRVADALFDVTRVAMRSVPDWLEKAGYTPNAFRTPEPGDLFYDSVRDKVLRCAEDIETESFVILDYRAVV